MVYATKAAARLEAKRLKRPHRILPAHRHAVVCLVSSGQLGTPPHACTCGQATPIGYVLQLVGR